MLTPTLANRHSGLTSKLITGGCLPGATLEKLNSSGAAKGGDSFAILSYSSVNTHADAQISGVEPSSHGVQHTVTWIAGLVFSVTRLSRAIFLFYTRTTFFFFTTKPITVPGPSGPRKESFQRLRATRLQYCLTRNLRSRYTAYLLCVHVYTAPWLRIAQQQLPVTGTCRVQPTQPSVNFALRSSKHFKGHSQWSNLTSAG